MADRILVLSSVLPTALGGGGLVLRRHLLRLDPSEWSVELVCAGEKEVPEEWPVHRIGRLPIPKRLRRTRLGPRLNDWIFSGGLVSSRSVSRLIDRIRPDVLLTVAHGELSPVALAAAHRHGIPLVTFFHDWWPDIAHGTPHGKEQREREFQELFGSSDAALCVCEGMLRELGGGNHASVLLPIPDEASVEVTTTHGGELTIAYAGTLAGSYGEMVRELASDARDKVWVDFRFSGPEVGWVEKGFAGYQGMLQIDQCRELLAQQDVLLVIMSFQEADRRRARTSFPSKLLEYARIGKPVVIWGPEYCSAVVWAGETGAAEIVTDRATSSLFAALELLRKKPGRFDQLANSIREVARTEFCPNRIQHQFERTLREVLSSR